MARYRKIIFSRFLLCLIRLKILEFSSVIRNLVMFKMCSDKYSLGIISSFSLICSLAYLFLFSLPHSSWIPVSPEWQEISLNIIVSGANSLTWTPGDDRYLLLNSFASALGALGFNRDKVIWSMYLRLITMECTGSPRKHTTNRLLYFIYEALN